MDGCSWHDPMLIVWPVQLHPFGHRGQPPALQCRHEKEDAAKQPKKPAAGKQGEKQQEKTDDMKRLLRVHVLHAFFHRGWHTRQNLLDHFLLGYMQLCLNG